MFFYNLAFQYFCSQTAQEQTEFQTFMLPIAPCTDNTYFLSTTQCLLHLFYITLKQILFTKQ